MPAEPLFEIDLPMRWGDQDAFGHLNNAVYFRLLEEARCQWLEAEGYRVVGVQDGPLMAHQGLNYRLPVVYPAQLRVRAWVTRIGQTSLTLQHEIEVEGRRVADGPITMVWVSATSQRPMPLPDWLRSRCADKVVGEHD